MCIIVSNKMVTIKILYATIGLDKGRYNYLSGYEKSTCKK